MEIVMRKQHFYLPQSSQHQHPALLTGSCLHVTVCTVKEVLALHFKPLSTY